MKNNAWHVTIQQMSWYQRIYVIGSSLTWRHDLNENKWDN